MIRVTPRRDDLRFESQQCDGSEEVTDAQVSPQRGRNTLTLAALLTGDVLALAPARAKTPDCTPRPSADLAGCNLSNDNLSLIDLSGSNLKGANLSGTNLDGTELNGANLTDTNLEGAGIVADCVAQCPFRSIGVLGLGEQYQPARALSVRI